MTLASETVRALLAAKITALGYTALEFRDQDDATTPDELPFVLIQQAGTIEILRLEGMAGGATYHSAPYFLTFAAETREDAAAMMAATVAELADDYNLGGQVMEIQPVSYGDEDNDGKDLTAIMLEVRIVFATAPNDFTTLLT